MAEAISGREEGHGNRWVHRRVVERAHTLFAEEQAVTIHDVLAQHHRQEFVVRDVLHDGRHDVTRFLIDSLIVPMGIDVSQFDGDAVVFAHHDCMKGDEHHLLIGSTVSGKETIRVSVWADASGVGTLQFRRQQVFETEVMVSRVAFEKSALKSTQLVRRFLGRSVNEIRIQRARNNVHRVART